MTSDGAQSDNAARPSYWLLGRKERRRLMLRLLIRTVLTSTLLVILYYALPLTGAIDSSAVAGLAVGLLVFTGVLLFQIRAVASSAYPRLRAIETLATSVPLLLILFASTYFLMAKSDGIAFSQRLTRTGALYFTMTILSTVGFGDIVPKTDTARIVTMVQMVVDLAVVGLVARMLLSAIQVGIRRRSGDSSATSVGQDP